MIYCNYGEHPYNDTASLHHDALNAFSKNRLKIPQYNQNPYILEAKAIKWSNEKVQIDKH